MKAISKAKLSILSHTQLNMYPVFFPHLHSEYDFLKNFKIGHGLAKYTFHILEKSCSKTTLLFKQIIYIYRNIQRLKCPENF